MKPSPQEVTRLLHAWRNGDASALDELMPLVYDELRRVAQRQMARQASGHTLQTTALVNEAYTRLVKLNQAEWQDRAHFFAVCSKIMRRILVDRFRRHRRHPLISLDEVEMALPGPDIDLLALDEALSRLEALNERQSQIVELRFFGGLTEEEVAEVLKVSPSTVKRDWQKARAWLYRELRREEER
ncbi:MAG: sigma-70 family RNA polymerase sigma factor [Acidobacteriota bacterium]